VGIQLADVLRPGALAPMRFLMLAGPGELLFTFPVGKMYENWIKRVRIARSRAVPELLDFLTSMEQDGGALSSILRGH
jgi:hypothetical protein